ncbi:MAG: L,D-transpeptidase [Anaerolineae bacterium]|nr:MAG: L,D-transpeptidase [Anaerolineae bacterium]
MAISRRQFLQLAGLGLGGLALRPLRRWFALPDFPKHSRLGRVATGKVELKVRPDYDSETVGVLYDDAIVPWLHEVVGYRPGRNNQRYVETPQGYIWSADLQPVAVHLNEPVQKLPVMGDVRGMWVEVTVPYVDAALANPPARSPWIKFRLESGLPPRLYYSQILWVDDLRVDEDGQTWYRINERYGNPGDIFWADARAFRPLTPEDCSPIHPEAEDKRIVVDVTYDRQYLSCYEGNTEVYFCRISSGRGEGSTPITPAYSDGFPIWRKLFSVHMAGGTNADGWDLPGIAWTSLFVGEGVAIHSTFWHNNFGEPMSHGCVNVAPDDARWIFRWTQPDVDFAAGDRTIVGSGSTLVKVVSA